MSFDKILALTKTIVIIYIKLPMKNETISQTMLMEKHQRITLFFSDEFEVRNDEVRKC